MNWIAGIPGLDCHDRSDSPETMNRLAAVVCAIRLHPINLTATQFRGTEAEAAARKFYEWLRTAKDDLDYYLRRLALAIACDQPRDDASDDQVLKLARSVHTWVIQSRPRPKASS